MSWKHEFDDTIVINTNLIDMVENHDEWFITETQSGFEMDPKNTSEAWGICFPVVLSLLTGRHVDGILADLRDIVDVNICNPDAHEGTDRDYIDAAILNLFEVEADDSWFRTRFNKFQENVEDGTFIVSSFTRDYGHISIVQDGVEFGTADSTFHYIDKVWQVA